MVRAAILQIEKDKGIEVTDEMIVDIIAKEELCEFLKFREKKND